MLGVAAPVLRLQLPEIAKILDSRGQKYFSETRSSMFGSPLMSLPSLEPKIENEMIGKAVKEMITIADMFKGNISRQPSECFLEGTPSYADFSIVAVLAWFHQGSRKIWERLLECGDGEIENLWNACLPWLEGQGKDVDFNEEIGISSGE
jgi:hypothetical protein